MADPDNQGCAWSEVDLSSVSLFRKPPPQPDFLLVPETKPQQWEVRGQNVADDIPEGWEPFAVGGDPYRRTIWLRRRIQ